MAENFVKVGRRTLYLLHESGKNRAERRMDAALERNKPFKKMKAAVERQFKINGENRIRENWARGAEAHARAVARREAAAGIKPSLTRRALQAIGIMKRRELSRRARRNRYAAKYARD